MAGYVLVNYRGFAPRSRFDSGTSLQMWLESGRCTVRFRAGVPAPFSGSAY